jgi:predicted nucleotidyltransferase component of viral defense system
MDDLDISKWVLQENNPLDLPFRQAVHTILYAVSVCQDISSEMIMKGAVLLAIRYQCIRHTKDIDFSTTRKRSGFDKDKFLSGMNQSLITATEALDYGLDCRVQSYQWKPPSPEASIPTLKIRIGYAYKHDRRAHKRLVSGNCSTVVEIDYSFNEVTCDVEDIALKNGGRLSVYSYTDLVAEKYRAILQQSKRNRNRRQDVYDLYYLFTHHPPPAMSEKRRILESLIQKSAARAIEAKPDSMKDPDIIERSMHEYQSLQAEIIGDLPEFEEAYRVVRLFFESLPWH